MRFRDGPTLLVNPGNGDAAKTVVVLGAFRGGTSMVAGVMRALGVFMGQRFRLDHPEYPNHEDLDFQALLHPVFSKVDEKIRSNDALSDADFSLPAGLPQLIGERNNAHRLWGWKYPGTVLWLIHSQLATGLRNPHFVTVFRDPLAICQCEMDVARLTEESLRAQSGQISFRWVSRQIAWLSEHLMQCQYPHLLVSYERTKSNQAAKAAFVDSLAKFLGLVHVGAEQRTDAIATIR